MNILILNHEYPPLEGGAANATFHLAREMASQGHAVRVVTLNLFGGPSVSREDGVTVIRLPFRRRRQGAFSYRELLSYWVRGRAVVLKLCRESRPDLLHAFFAFPDGLIAGRAARALGIPCVVSLRGSDVPGFRQGALAAAAYAALRPVLRAQWRRPGVQIVANSEGLRALALRTTPDVDIRVIPNGVDCARFSPAPAAKRKPGPFVILTVGQLVPRKGIGALIDLLPAVRAQTARDVRLTIVGRGRLGGELEKQARAAGVGDVVEFAGHVEPADMPRRYRAADAFVLLSRREGMANALLEALASGLPVVTTGVEGVSELVRDGEEGFVVNPGDRAATIDRIARLVADDALCERMGAKARAKAEAFSWERIVDGYLAVYAQGAGAR